MLQVHYENWNQSPDFLRDLALNGEHPRTRERFFALFEIVNGKNATQIGHETGRNPQTVMEWVHKYNNEGHESLFYKRTGGSLPLFVRTLPIVSRA
jgi:Helix-turn-helix domain